jgi:hypothetical protein
MYEQDYTIIHELDDDAAITLVRLSMDAMFEDREFDVTTEV